MNGIELLERHCDFETNYDCYVLLAVSRKKDTPEITNSQEIVFREVIKNTKDIKRKYNKIKAQITNYKDEEGKSFPFYLYVSLNRRDAKKATFILLNQMLGWIQEETNGTDRSKQLKKIYGQFYSALMKKEARSTGQKYFMIDFDEKDTIVDFMKTLVRKGIPYEFYKESRNGYHVKLKAFNRELLKDVMGFDYEVKTDANLFVEYVDNKDKVKEFMKWLGTENEKRK